MGNRYDDPWWFPLLSDHWQKVVQGISYYKRQPHYAAAKIALPYLEGLGLCMKNESAFGAFLDSTKDADFASTRDEYLQPFLALAGVPYKDIPAKYRVFPTKDSFLAMA